MSIAAVAEAACMGDLTMAGLVAVAAAGVVATAGVVAAAGHRCGALFYRVTSTGDEFKLERAVNMNFANMLQMATCASLRPKQAQGASSSSRPSPPKQCGEAGRRLAEF